MDLYEKLGVFYLGRPYDLASRQTAPRPLLYDSNDLTTHAVCVGMTGSGKTGLCLALLEEAAIDGIPVIAIDPKGDVGNLLLTFPELRPADFRPWIDPDEARREEISDDELAARTAQRWRAGLADWDQTPDRIAHLRDAADLAIYTPGSSAGRSLTPLRSFDAPPRAVLDDEEAFRERVTGAASGLLALVGVEADPVQSREHILLASILEDAWRAGQNVSIAELIHRVQDPPFPRVGVMDLETFFPEKARTQLAMQLNNLLASPAFAGWMDGEPLDVKHLLYTPEGKPRISIVSIAHLSDAERMFFVTLLLEETLSWLRTQPGTSSLRALIYMDEVFGYFPPTANPPSKRPMLTLLKQARAYGLGIVLATQNPVDLDYKGLSNIGTWFLGRLQTERDKLRVLDGLEGASAQSGSQFDRRQMDATLSALGQRVFLLHNVHDDHPVVFQTRWAMSYLRGPLTRNQIATLMRAGDAPPAVDPAQTPSPTEPIHSPATSPANHSIVDRRATPVVLPATVQQYTLSLAATAPADADQLSYRPALLGQGRLHYVRRMFDLELWSDVLLFAPLDETLAPKPWSNAQPIDASSVASLIAGPPSAPLAPLPCDLAQETTFTRLARQFKDHLHAHLRLTIYRCPGPKLISEPPETEGDFRIRLTQALRDERQRELEDLKRRYQKKLEPLQKRLDEARRRAEREQLESQHRTFGSLITAGGALFEALLGRKLASRTNVARATRSARDWQRAAQDRSQAAAAQQRVDELEQQVADLAHDFAQESAALASRIDPQNISLESIVVPPLKKDILVEPIQIVWTPWTIDPQGAAMPAWLSVAPGS